jgi:hypothetical protein
MCHSNADVMMLALLRPLGATHVIIVMTPSCLHAPPDVCANPTPKIQFP